MPNPLARVLACVLALILALGGAFAAGWLAHEAHATKAELKQQVKAEAKQETKTVEAGKIVNEPAVKYETRKAILSSSVGDIDYRLRVPACKPMPDNAGTASESNASAEERTGPDRTGQINLDGIGKEIVQLGIDLKAANIQIEELQELVLKYKQACSLD